MPWRGTCSEPQKELLNVVSPQSKFVCPLVRGTEGSVGSGIGIYVKIVFPNQSTIDSAVGILVVRCCDGGSACAGRQLVGR